MHLILHLAGNHPTLPRAELEAALAACGLRWTPGKANGRILQGAVDHPSADAPAMTRQALARLALTREADAFLFAAAREPEALAQAARAHPLPSTPGAPPSRFMVRAEYAHSDLRGLASPAAPGRGETERILGQVWGATARVDLENPQEVLRAWIHDDEIWIGRRIWANDAAGYQARAPRHRPYFSPVSGHPSLMRAVLNLARVAPGGLVYDPLVGTGGILLEAGLAGMRIAGSDCDPTMVQGTRENLERYGVKADALFLADVREADERFLLATGRRHVDAVVTDLPYGQSSTTGGAPPAEVARWTMATAARLLPAGRRLVIGTAQGAWLQESASLGFQEESRFDVRIHKSLTRSYLVLRRRPS